MEVPQPGLPPRLDDLIDPARKFLIVQEGSERGEGGLGTRLRFRSDEREEKVMCDPESRKSHGREECPSELCIAGPLPGTFENRVSLGMAGLAHGQRGRLGDGLIGRIE